MNAFSRSWELTKSTFGVMRNDKEIFAFPILAIIVSITFLVILGLLLFVGGLVSLLGGFSMSAFGYLALLLFYFVLAIVNTFFSVCIVYTAGTRFSGKDATLGQSISFGFKKIGKVFSWAILSATVGLIIHILEGIAKSTKGIGKVFLNVITWVIGMTWAISTIFVIQGIAYKDLGPFASIKDSVLTLKKTWGESLIKYFGLGLAKGVILFIGIVIFIPLAILGFVFGHLIAGIVLIGLFVIYSVIVEMIFSLADEVFDTALYVYANTGQIPSGFTPEQMKEALKPEKKEAVFGLA
jgi:hypothetical protein